MEKMKDLGLGLSSLAVFRALLSDPVICRLHKLLTASGEEGVWLYGDFVSALYETGFESLADYVADVVGDNENPYIRAIGKGVKPGSAMEQTVQRELELLQAVAELTPQQLSGFTGYTGALPGFEVKKTDFPGMYRHRRFQHGRHYEPLRRCVL